ncbi:hypothetical protein [Paraburkholderia caballeronis]|uniref:Carboxypeptidase regulatory-like domain-containing protein n=1 Tax=Paraburkholderia caballeronis TaxID=416943 RepID=A0A1H7S7G4_9BURK|nr:hypothetical protein [Paraburkholderia caballeronis]PXW22928.1 hypothetical protein C7403_112129 [Paraburkholderia caballeronis]PXW97313.1 hypothetical protein C7407_112129 [Paraburkholderia caballeronis]RAJ93833.1 hypothetical protein C7409_112129 [Paraburkholderia caballeronis]SED56261.1 hypothetical protein SAMN05445871_3434 [Paraburkholderia caballeronis]SEL68475.1 hypothetical protein SAMN05192542_111129 [Paraburkholderia caballeronis]
MNQRDNTFRHRKTALASCAALLLAACGGGGDSGSNGSGSVSASRMTGTVASGYPVASASVTATDANGKTAAATADANGSYTLPTTGLAAPIVLVATDPSGRATPMVSILASLPASGSNATVNVTTLTTALAALLTPDSNPLDFVTPGAATSLSDVTPAKVQAATATLDQYLANLLTAAALPATFDPIGTAFTANHTGADALLDLVSIVPEGAATYLAYSLPPTSATQDAAYLQLNSATVGSANVPATPAVSATTLANASSLSGYLGTLPGLLKPCVAAGGAGSACGGVIDASYKDNGYTNLTQYEPDLASSDLSLGSPSIVALNASGTGALIGIPYALTTAAGNLGDYTVYTTVQQTAGGTWAIVGNQLDYDVSVSTRTTYRHFLDAFTNSTGNADADFVDAGLSLNVNLNGPNGGNINSAHVTGPGLPDAGLWLAISTVTGDGSLAIETTQQSGPPSAGANSGGSNTNEYRWSYATPPNGQPFTPPTKGFWRPTPIDVTALPMYGVYQFTLYDGSGNPLAQLSVTNPNPPADASLGVSAYTQGNSTAMPQGAWPGLGSDVATNFLAPTGSLAAAQTSVTVDFTQPPTQPDNLDPLTLTGVQVQSEQKGHGGSGGTGYEKTATVPDRDTTSVTVTAASGQSFLAIGANSPPTYRIVQLRSKNAHGVLFYWNATYRNSAQAPDAA